MLRCRLDMSSPKTGSISAYCGLKFRIVLYRVHLFNVLYIQCIQCIPPFWLLGRSDSTMLRAVCLSYSWLWQCWCQICAVRRLNWELHVLCLKLESVQWLELRRLARNSCPSPGRTSSNFLTSATMSPIMDAQYWSILHDYDYKLTSVHLFLQHKPLWRNFFPTSTKQAKSLHSLKSWHFGHRMKLPWSDAAQLQVFTIHGMCTDTVQDVTKESAPRQSSRSVAKRIRRHFSMFKPYNWHLDCQMENRDGREARQIAQIAS